MPGFSFLTNHSLALLCIANDPEIRLRDIASRLDITGRSAYTIVTDLTSAGYLSKTRDWRRNTYEIQAHLPLPDTIGSELTIGDVLDLFAQPTGR